MEHVAVIGAGPAGSAAAFVLANAGVPVDLIDRLAFPRDKTCGDAIGAKSVRSLSQLGLRHLLGSAQAVTAERYLDAQLQNLRYVEIEASGDSTVIMTRRRFDAAMRKSAILAGARPLQARFIGFGSADSSGKTVSLSFADGSVTENNYAFVIGADGARSAVAHAAGLHPGIGAACAVAVRQYMTVPSGIEPELLFFEPAVGSHNGANEYHWAFPSATDRLNVGVYSCGPSAAQGMSSRLRTFQRRLRSYFGEEEIVSPAGPVRGGIVRYDFDPTRVTTDRVALAGDAAGISNAVLGEGIFYAIRSGQLVAESLLAADLNYQSAEVLISDRLDAAFTRTVSTTRYAVHHGMSLFMRTSS